MLPDRNVKTEGGGGGGRAGQPQSPKTRLVCYKNTLLLLCRTCLVCHAEAIVYVAGPELPQVDVVLHPTAAVYAQSFVDDVPRLHSSVEVPHRCADVPGVIPSPIRALGGVPSGVNANRVRVALTFSELVYTGV